MQLLGFAMDQGNDDGSKKTRPVSRATKPGAQRVSEPASQASATSKVRPAAPATKPGAVAVEASTTGGTEPGVF